MDTTLFKDLLLEREHSSLFRQLLDYWRFQVTTRGTPADQFYVLHRVVPPPSGWTQGETGLDDTIPFFDENGHCRFELKPHPDGYEFIPFCRFEIVIHGYRAWINDTITGKELKTFEQGEETSAEEQAAQWLDARGFPNHRDYTKYWELSAPK